MLKDIHTHHIGQQTEERLVSCSMPDTGYESCIMARYVSLSLHPWYITGNNLEQQLEWIERNINDTRVLALGEAGLDRMCHTEYHLQERAFSEIIRLSERHALPLIIHCVKAFNEIVRFKKEINPQQPWIIHGFRGKRELMEMLLHHDMYISFGEKYQEQCLFSIPLNRMFIETDESNVAIEELYSKAAAIRRMNTGNFTQAIQNNVRLLFPRLKSFDKAE